MPRKLRSPRPGHATVVNGRLEVEPAWPLSCDDRESARASPGTLSGVAVGSPNGEFVSGCSKTRAESKQSCLPPPLAG
jgi:hypothetical protein